jgi:predicted enzyme related to lactoylglutathione lyase
VTIVWLTAFIDRPAERFDAATAFWAAVTGSAVSPARGARDEFATLVPADGDAYVRVQRVDAGGGIHLDVHVDDVAAAVDAATGLGASPVHQDAGVPVLRSPSGMVFCVVADDGSRRRPAAPIVEGVRSQLDRVCIDIPAPDYDAERHFWAALTGWELRGAPMNEFSYLALQQGLALGLLLQRLEPDSPATEAGAHLDLACDDVDAMVGTHRGLGAAVMAEHEHWTVMADPAGLPYCLIRRPPLS